MKNLKKNSKENRLAKKVANSSQKIFFTGAYHFQRKEVLILGLFLSFFAVFTGRIIPQMFATRAPSFNLNISVAFMGGICAICSYFGFVFLFRWAFFRRNVLEITPTGITYGGKFRPWEEIGWFGMIDLDGYPMLAYKIKGGGFFSYARKLPVDPNPSGWAYQKLRQTLSDSLQGKYPHIVFG